MSDQLESTVTEAPETPVEATASIAEVSDTESAPSVAEAETAEAAEIVDATQAEAEAAAEPAEQAETAVEAVAEPVEAEAKAEPAVPAEAEAKAEPAVPAEAEAKAEPAEQAKAKAEGDGDAKVAESAETENAETEEPSPEMIALTQAMQDKTDIDGQIIGWNKGGYHVAIGKVAAFCPVSQIEIGNPRSPKRYLDKSFKFHVIEIQKGGRRVVLSRAAALKAERAERAKKVRERLKQGTEIEGKVTSLTDFGAFVDLGDGIEGLVHVSEISRKRVEHPKEMVKVGDQVKVVVLKIEKGGERISLSMKRLEEDPWKGVAERFSVGQKLEGTILRQAEFGLFVEVEAGLEGLVHTSRLTLGTRLSDESLAVGNKIDVWVHEIEGKRRRLSLSMREVVEGNPWDGIEDRFPEGELVKGMVERLAKFGAFIELEPGLTGLLPFSEVGGAQSANLKRQFHVGKEVSIKVLSIDKERKRISLGTESSKAAGSSVDFREYQKQQKQKTSSGFSALAAAFEKLKDGSEG